jgi:hypothetical protein
MYVFRIRASKNHRMCSVLLGLVFALPAFVVSSSSKCVGPLNVQSFKLKVAGSPLIGQVAQPS